MQIRTNEKVEAVQKNSPGFRVRTAQGNYKAHYVVLALGKRGTPRRLGVEGENLPKVAYRLIEVESYQHKDILVVGGGDSAVEAALAVSHSGTNRVTLSYRGESFRRVRDRNRDQLHKAEIEGRLRVLLRSNVEQITDTHVLLACPDGAVSLPNEYAFLLLGGECTRRVPAKGRSEDGGEKPRNARSSGVEVGNP